MATITCEDGRLKVRFTRPEHVCGLVKDLDVPTSSVVAAEPLTSWRGKVWGFRVGTALPGVWLLGRWWGRGRRQLVAVRRGRPLVLVRLVGEQFDELLIESPDPEALTRSLGFAPAR